MILEYQLTEEDYLQFNYYTSWKDPQKKSDRIHYHLKNLLITCFLTAVIYVIAQPDRPLEFIVFVLGVTLLMLFATINDYLKSVYRSRVREFLADKRNHYLLSHLKLVIDDSGLSEFSGATELRVKWEGIVKTFENDRYYYLYINTTQAIIIPKYSLNDAERSQLDIKLKQNIPLSVAFDEF